MSDSYLNKVRTETERDVCLQATLEYTITGWPAYKEDAKLVLKTKTFP